MRALIYFLLVLFPMVGKAQGVVITSKKVRTGTLNSNNVWVTLKTPTVTAWNGKELQVGKRIYGVAEVRKEEGKTYLRLNEGGVAILDPKQQVFFLVFPAGNQTFTMSNCTFTY